MHKGKRKTKEKEKIIKERRTDTERRAMDEKTKQNKTREKETGKATLGRKYIVAENKEGAR